MNSLSKISLVLLSIVVLGSCSNFDGLKEACRVPCYSGFTENIDVGLCKSGMTVCGEDKKRTGECIGEILPMDEICDGADNNCNGVVDEWYEHEPLTLWYTEGVCEQYGVCYNSIAYCISGKWECDYPSSYEKIETTCDGLDNDCNGETDDLSPRGACFGELGQSDWWKATNPPCRLGVELCNSRLGAWECVSSVLPSIELCNRVDDDCDGQIDNNTIDNTPLDYDIVIIIDDSASMCNEIFAVAGALREYVEQFDANSHFRFALVLMTYTFEQPVNLDIPFGSLSAIVDRLIEIGNNCSGSGFCEASLDSMYEVCSSNDTLNLGWRATAGRMFFAFTDEGPQSCYSVDSLITYHDVIDECSNSKTLPFVWYNDDNSDFNNSGSYVFNYICEEVAGGQGFQLSNNQQDMLYDMNSIVDSLCGM